MDRDLEYIFYVFQRLHEEDHIDIPLRTRVLSGIIPVTILSTLLNHCVTKFTEKRQNIRKDVGRRLPLDQLCAKQKLVYVFPPPAPFLFQNAKSGMDRPKYCYL